jgi:hypothetical protein
VGHPVRMARTRRRGSPALSPMPVRLTTDALLRVSDQAGRIVRSEPLPAGTDLRERLRIAQENYERQGWTVGALPAGQWAFMAEKADRRLLIAIRAMPSDGLAAETAFAPDPIPRRTV